ncbi:unnamed protein product [Oreochromis niloticus]|nr:unnamed protein product [Mustela putorius furo]
MALQQFVCCFTVVIIFFCKGCHSEQPRSLITDQWVLTAASSVPKDYSSMVVLLGSNSLSGPNPNKVRLNVINATCHPGFNSSTRENNICLLKLSAPVNFTDYIQPICLASENSTFNNESSSWAIGFGGIEEFSFNLQEAKVSIVGNNVCKARFPWIPDSIICTRETDSCWDTLGAPLMTQSKSVWLQSGVFNVPGCTASPSVYTPVSQYQKWISDTVTGTPPGFVTFTSPDGSLQTTAPPTAPPTAPLTVPPTTPTAPPTSPTCVGVFCSGENLIHFTHFTSLCVLVVLLHVFAGTVGK